MLLQWLMLLMLLVHNSLAFPGMYEDIDGKCFQCGTYYTVIYQVYQSIA